MKKKGLVIAISIFALLNNGCSVYDNGTDKLYESEYMEVNDMDKIELTEQEEKLLCDLYMNEDRIREGKLYDYQVKCLEKIRFGMEYLKNKYPGKSFVFLTCNPQSKVNSSTIITFYEKKDKEKNYTLEIKTEGDSDQGFDNYYGSLLADAYDQAVAEKLLEEGIEGCVTFTTFRGLHGNEVDGSLTVEKIFKKGSALGRNTDIFIDSDLYDIGMRDEIVDTIKTVMIQNDLYGSYHIYFIHGILEQGSTGEQSEAYVIEHQGDADIYVQNFNCFDE